MCRCGSGDYLFDLKPPRLVEAVLAKTLHEPPLGTERWSSRRLASEIGISQRAVLRIWRAFEL